MRAYDSSEPFSQVLFPYGNCLNYNKNRKFSKKNLTLIAAQKYIQCAAAAQNETLNNISAKIDTQNKELKEIIERLNRL